MNLIKKQRKYNLSENQAVIQGWSGLMSKNLNPEKPCENLSWTGVDEIMEYAKEILHFSSSKTGYLVIIPLLYCTLTRIVNKDRFIKICKNPAVFQFIYEQLKMSIQIMSKKV